MHWFHPAPLQLHSAGVFSPGRGHVSPLTGFWLAVTPRFLVPRLWPGGCSLQVHESLSPISQLRAPVAVFIPVPERSKFASGAAPKLRVPAEFLHREAGWLRFTRDRAASHKTGNDSSTLIWAGERQLLRIDLAHAPGAAAPDDGCSVEVYSNADPVPYVELETLGPLQMLQPGEHLSATNTYRLARRSEAPLETDVRALLAR